jgi:hypothetical protein
MRSRPETLNFQGLAASRLGEKPLALGDAAIRQDGVDLGNGSSIARALVGVRSTTRIA